MAIDKFKAMTHFIIHECRENPNKLGSIRLNKALWYADIIAFKRNGKTITGHSYLKRQRGPVPSKILATLDALNGENLVRTEEPQFEFDMRKFFSLVEPDTGDLSDDERRLATAALNVICRKTANEVSDGTHDVVWEAAAMGEEIPMYATLASRQGELTDDVLTWADKSIAAREGT